MNIAKQGEHDIISFNGLAQHVIILQMRTFQLTIIIIYFTAEAQSVKLPKMPGRSLSASATDLLIPTAHAGATLLHTREVWSWTKLKALFNSDAIQDLPEDVRKYITKLPDDTVLDETIGKMATRAASKVAKGTDGFNAKFWIKLVMHLRSQQFSAAIDVVTKRSLDRISAFNFRATNFRRLEHETVDTLRTATTLVNSAKALRYDELVTYGTANIRKVVDHATGQLSVGVNALIPNLKIKYAMTDDLLPEVEKAVKAAVKAKERYHSIANMRAADVADIKLAFHEYVNKADDAAVAAIEAQKRLYLLAAESTRSTVDAIRRGKQGSLLSKLDDILVSDAEARAIASGIAPDAASRSLLRNRPVLDVVQRADGEVAHGAAVWNQLDDNLIAADLWKKISGEAATRGTQRKVIEAISPQQGGRLLDDAIDDANDAIEGVAVRAGRRRTSQQGGRLLDDAIDDADDAIAPVRVGQQGRQLLDGAIDGATAGARQMRRGGRRMVNVDYTLLPNQANGRQRGFPSAFARVGETMQSAWQRWLDLPRVQKAAYVFMAVSAVGFLYSTAVQIEADIAGENKTAIQDMRIAELYEFVKAIESRMGRNLTIEELTEADPMAAEQNDGEADSVFKHIINKEEEVDADFKTIVNETEISHNGVNGKTLYENSTMKMVSLNVSAMEIARMLQNMTSIKVEELIDILKRSIAKNTSHTSAKNASQSEDEGFNEYEYIDPVESVSPLDLKLSPPNDTEIETLQRVRRSATENGTHTFHYIWEDSISDALLQQTHPDDNGTLWLIRKVPRRSEFTLAAAEIIRAEKLHASI